MFRRMVLGVVAFMAMNSAFAIDPIRWSLNESFPVPVNTTSGAYTVVYTLTNQLPFTLVKPILIDKAASPAAEFTYVDQCSGLKLAPQQHCTVSVLLKPVTSGEKRAVLTITGFDNNRVPLPALVTSTTGSSTSKVSVSTTTALPPSMTVNSTQPFAFQFKNNGTSSVTGVTATSNAAGFVTTCGASLAAGSFCSVSGNFTPTSTTLATQSATARFSYTQGSSVVGTTSTTVTAATGITGVVTGLPGITTVNQTYSIVYTFTNHEAGAVALANTGTVTPSVGCALGFGSIISTCGASIAAGGQCTLTQPYTPTASAASCVVTGTLTPTTPPPAPVAVIASTVTQALGTGNRTITFTNSCNFDVWFSLNGGAITNSPTCPGTPCPTGTTCNTGSGLCYWNNYAPANNVFQLTPSGTATVNLPTPPSNPYDSATLWSGNLSASTGCSGSSCLQADCQNNGGTTSCAPGVGFSQPATQAEFTFLKSSVDSYDVEVINGFHIPISVTPSGGSSVNGYYCGSPGATTAGNGFGACNWNNAVVPGAGAATVNVPYPSTSYYWVTAGGAPCTSGSQSCSNPNQLCGLDIGINQVCGDFLGFWTANNACAINSSKAQAYFGCNNLLGSPFSSNTYQMSQLYGCKRPSATQSTLNSCYLQLPPLATGTNSDCCGCVDWQSLPGITLPAGTVSCNGTSDPIWVTNTTLGGGVQPTLQWIKTACPNYYTYPFDDKSSSFTCSSSNPPSTATNTVNYTIEFCAGNITGLPAGKTDGR